MAGERLTSAHDMSPAKRRKLARERFSKARRVEGEFGRALDAVVKKIKKAIGKDLNTDAIIKKLKAYSKKLEPWAKDTVGKMHQQVLKRDEKSWSDFAQEIGLTQVKKKLKDAPVQPTLRDLLKEQVQLIKSIPAEAAQRVHDLTLRGIAEGTQSSVIRDLILKGTDVSRSKAQLIARTEVARTASLLTEVRAKYIGSEGYIWRTSLDQDVRKQHKKLEGRFIRWSAPPVAGTNGMKYHAGQGPNCRCYPEPVIPDDLN